MKVRWTVLMFTNYHAPMVASFKLSPARMMRHAVAGKGRACSVYYLTDTRLVTAYLMPIRASNRGLNLAVGAVRLAASHGWRRPQLKPSVGRDIFPIVGFRDSWRHMETLLSCCS